MVELPFASFCNRFSGQEGWVVGRGPTRFRYEELGGARGPVFFINDAVGQEKWLPENHPAFFFAHDAAMDHWLFRERLRSIPVLIVDQPLTGPKESRRKGLISGADDPRVASLPQAIFYRKHGPLDRASLLGRSREEIQKSGQLHTAGGTIHPLLHFAWYVGCARLRLVGCDGLPGVGYDRRLENQSRSRQQGAISIRVQQEEILRRLSLARIYLGPPPHRIEMSMEIRVPREKRGKFLAWAETLLAQFRTSGCTDLVVHDFVDRGSSCWIKGTWPGIDACVECLISPSYREMTQNALSPLLEAPAAGLKVAFKAVLAE